MKRYRDPRQLYQSVGFLYESHRDGQQGAPVIRVTELGRTVLRWLDLINEKNAPILGRHAAYALSACQLRNPVSRTARRFDQAVEVFPFAFIWRAMLCLENRISSDELNRALFRVRNESELTEAIERIAEARRTGQIEVMGEETITGPAKNDRIIPWMSMASFGWILISDKRSADGDWYEIPQRMVPLIESAAQLKHRHRDFSSIAEYVEHISSAAALPRDLR
mgnify:CR=1 FL=1